MPGAVRLGDEGVLLHLFERLEAQRLHLGEVLDRELALLRLGVVWVRLVLVLLRREVLIVVMDEFADDVVVDVHETLPQELHVLPLQLLHEGLDLLLGQAAS